MVDEVMDERRPNTQENGRDIATAPVPIFATCMQSDILPGKYYGNCTYLSEELVGLPEAAQENKNRQAC